MRRRSPVPQAAVLLVLGLAAAEPVANATATAWSPTASRLVVVAPGLDVEALVAATGGRVAGRVPGGGLVVEGRRADLALRLWQGGAWLVLPAGRPAPAIARRPPGPEDASPPGAQAFASK